MSRKHNTKHPNRGLSKYTLRLARRGYHKTPTMESLADLKRRQKDIQPVSKFKVLHPGWGYYEEEE
jgi:hypothetical protein